jgi:hypothetical protein
MNVDRAKAKVGVYEDFALAVVAEVAEAAYPPLGRRRSGRHSYGFVTVTSPSRRAWLAAKVKRYLRGWWQLPHNVKIAAGVLQDTGTGHTLGWEDRWGWAIRRACGWRSWCWPSRPLAVNRDLGREDEDEATDWALTVLDGQ